MLPGARYRGRVRSFDDPRGLGVIAVHGGGELAFHCTEIAGGSRTIAEGCAVSFSIRPGPGGAWEAASIEACRAPADNATGTDPDTTG